MKQTLRDRVVELSATLKPIKEYDSAYHITGEMYEEAEDSNSFNSSFYCNGWIKPIFEGDFKGVMLQSVEDFQVMRMYFICTRLEGLAYDEIPEDWEAPDAPDMPEMEITDVIEYRQIWFNQSEQVILPINEKINDYYRDQSYVVAVDSVQPWVFEPKYRQYVVDIVNEYPYCYDEKPLGYFLSPCCEMLMTKAPELHNAITQCDFTEKAVRYYRTLRVAIKHNYPLPTNEQDTRLYFDYLDMLASKKVCMTEPYYVCPADFSKEYNKLYTEREERLRRYHEQLAEQARIHEEKHEKENILKAEKDEAEFAEKHAWLFDINFDDENFCYQSLDSVEAYRLEGKTMHHCLFNCEYYKKHYMLAMHITDLEGNRVATCTINLLRRKIDAIQPMCNDTGFYRTYHRIWQDTDDYKQIYQTLMARMHTFPKKYEEPIKQQIKLIA